MASPLFMLRGAFRHPERSEMSDVRSCKGKAVRTESKDQAPRHHFAFLISNFSFKRSFHPQSKGDTPHGLPLPLNKKAADLRLPLPASYFTMRIEK